MVVIALRIAKSRNNAGAHTGSKLVNSVTNPRNFYKDRQTQASAPGDFS